LNARRSREKRERNERKFSYWAELEGGGRRYWYEVVGRFGFRARYVKEVDEREETIKFYQEIYDDKGDLVGGSREVSERFGASAVKKKNRRNRRKWRGRSLSRM